MKFAVLKESLRLCREARISAVIWGHRGIGKSEVVLQLTTEGDGEIIVEGDKKIALPIGFVDFRCSQIEASDVRGLPDKSDGRTVYLPPADMPIGDRSAKSIYEELIQIDDLEKRRVRRGELQPHYKKGILFLDELNRAQDDVLQSVFQLLLDGRIGQYALPIGWTVAVACNYMEGDYITNGFTDAALLDRMCHLHLVAGEDTLDDWVAYMADKHGEISSSVVEFCASNIDYMTGKADGELGFTIQPSPRSWDRVANIERIVMEKQFSQDARSAVINGLVGQECAIAYKRYACPVQPRDILNNGVKPYVKKLAKLDRNQLMGISYGFVSLVRHRMDDEKVVKIALDLAETLIDADNVHDKDVVVAFCRALLCTDDDKEVQLVSCLTNRELAGQVVKFYEKTNVFLKMLYGRDKLHTKLSTTGWGIDS